MAQALQTYECKTSSNERKGKGEKMKNLQMKSLSSLTTVILLVLCSAADASAAKASYLYSFSNFTGSLPYSWVRLASDKEHGEIYVINDGIVTVFNSEGMEIFHFGDEGNLGGITDVAVEKDGKILLLSYTGDTYSVLRCNFRGEPKETIQLSGLPQEFSQFSPRRLVYWKGYLYLADPFTRKVVVTDSRGIFVDGYDVGAVLAAEEKPGSENNIFGFNVDREGNMLVTIPTLFRAYRISRDHKVESFGAPGNLEGLFNVVSGIASDDRGYIYVVDTLKSVVMVYDKDFSFKVQFGYRGNNKDNLIAPQQLEVLGDKLFVSQARKRGISVFRISYD